MHPVGNYYAYDSINRSFGRRARLARLVFRVLVYVRPIEVSVAGNTMWATLAAEAVGKGTGGAGKAMIVDNPDRFHGWKDENYLIFTCLDTAKGRALWQRTIADNNARKLTVVDSHRRLGVIACRKGLPSQTIDLRTLLPSQ